MSNVAKGKVGRGNGQGRKDEEERGKSEGEMDKKGEG
jgi:hypothetical protein